MANPTNLGESPGILTVSEVTAMIRGVLESAFASLWIEGEIADLARARSGHIYFTLKDEGAQIPCVLWASTASTVKFAIEDGLRVLCRGRLSVYPPHGRYQLVVQRISPAGVGSLELALRRLKEKLSKEGLFAADRKRPLPAFSRTIAVITSPSGAAIHDFLTALRSRLTAADVVIVPVRVQGEEAAEEIAQALHWVNHWSHSPDCIVLTRGGGSLEDLAAFNTEMVVRAIAASRIPVVSAVGHEIDVTLADLAADVRALTPTDAAQRVLPAKSEVVERMSGMENRLLGAIRGRLQTARWRLDSFARHPVFLRPLDRLRVAAQRADQWDTRLMLAVRRNCERARHRWQAATDRLESLSPLAVLRRGYTVTHVEENGRPLRSSAEITPGMRLRTVFAEGWALSRVESTSRSQDRTPE
ncbi:exodeoxyribonuclease VII large subunit [Thermopirellula anaerolimosa]